MNFILVSGRLILRIRTYERGVEGKTLACGTGVAGALVGGKTRTCILPVHVITKGCEKLAVSFDRTGNEFSNLRLEGGAEVICGGNLYLP